MTGWTPPRSNPARAAVLLVLMGLVIWIGQLDLADGWRPWVRVLSAAPVVLSGWWMGPAAAGVCAVAAATAGVVHDAGRTDLGVALGNGAASLILFAVMGLLISRVRSDRGRLTDLLDREKTLARTDAVTGLMNHRGFVESLMREASRCRRAVQPLCVAFMDLDNFKQVNDHYGHAAGDTLLKLIARSIRETIRGGDIPARLGGDEFVVLFWDMDRNAVEGIAQRIIEKVREAGQDYPRAALGASVGIAYFDVPPASVEEILKRADNAMYEAKTMGKGLMAVWSSAETSDQPKRPVM
ncbi:MAG: GGDEF domain-containing protein [Candidatus Polarisedimenticolia bacterium]